MVMGLILCPKHGKAFICLVCPHLAAACRERQAGLITREIRGPGLSATVKETVWGRVCLECSRRLPEIDVDNEDAWFKAFESFWDEPLVPLCHQCLEEYLGAQRAS
jgi:hypothetical protein